MRWSRWAATLAVLLVLLLPALSLRRVDIVSPPPWLPRCAFHEVTGWHCPGCGNTRAAHALLHGDLAEALRQNALSVVALPFFAVFVWRSWFGWVLPGRLRPLRFQWWQGYTVAVVAVLLLFWLLRNLPWQPFAWLAPDPPKVRVIPASEGPSSPLRDAPPRTGR